MQSTVIQRTLEGVTLIQFSHFLEAGLMRHGITTRLGGVSTDPYRSLNMGRKTEDSPGNTEENRNRVAKALGVIPGSFVCSDQVHSTELCTVTEENRHEALIGIDGLTTDVPGITLSTLYADCMGILLYDPVRKAIGMAHAGWRGTVGLIGPRLVQQMVQQHGSRPEDLLAGLGPAIGPCCFEIGESVAEQFAAVASETGIESALIAGPKPHADLWAFNRQLLITAGLRESAVAECRQCTCCHPELFFSHRRDNGITGRMAAVMAL